MKDINDPWVRQKIMTLKHPSQLADFLFGKVYVYMVTFTLDPKKNSFSEKLYNKVEKYIKKQMSNLKSVTKLFIVREGGDEDHKHTHWHCAVESTKYIKKYDYGKYYQKIFGSVDHSKSVTGDLQHTLMYMNKQGTPTQLI